MLAVFQGVCIAVAVGLQFFFLAHFCFMVLEAVQTHAVRTNVISFGGYFSIEMNLLIGWGAPAFVTFFSALIRYNYYASHWR